MSRSFTSNSHHSPSPDVQPVARSDATESTSQLATSLPPPSSIQPSTSRAPRCRVYTHRRDMHQALSALSTRCVVSVAASALAQCHDPHRSTCTSKVQQVQQVSRVGLHNPLCSKAMIHPRCRKSTKPHSPRIDWLSPSLESTHSTTRAGHLPRDPIYKTRPATSYHFEAVTHYSPLDAMWSCTVIASTSTAVKCLSSGAHRHVTQSLAHPGEVDDQHGDIGIRSRTRMIPYGLRYTTTTRED